MVHTIVRDNWKKCPVALCVSFTAEMCSQLKIFSKMHQSQILALEVVSLLIKEQHLIGKFGGFITVGLGGIKTPEL